MPEGLEKIGIAVGLAVGLIIIAFVFLWLLPTELFVRVSLTGVLLIIVVILFVKNEIFEIF